MKQQLPEQADLIQSTKETIELDRALRIDVIEFEALVATRLSGQQRGEKLQAAVALADAELLNGWDEPWVDQRRSSLEAELRRVSISLVEHLLESDDLTRARATASAAVARFPLDESVYRIAFRVLDTQGATVDAQNLFDEMSDRFSIHLEVHPSDDLIVADERRRARTAKQHEPIRESHRLIGRGVERQRILESFTSAAEGFGTFFLVYGESGVGKSYLLDAIATESEWLGHTTGVGVCSRLAPPYAPITSALVEAMGGAEVAALSEILDKPWLARAKRMLPGLGWPQTAFAHEPGAEPGEGERQREALLQVVEGLASLRPFTLIVDDAQWADLDTLRLLAKLSSLIGGVGATIILTLRTEETVEGERGELLDEIGRGIHTERILLSGLDARAVWELAREIDADFAMSQAREIKTATGGNPLLVLHSVNSPGIAHSTPAIDDPIGARLDTLDSLHRTILDVLAIHGVALPVAGLTGTLTDHPPLEVAAGLLDLVGSRLVDEVRDGYEISHDRIRSCVLDRMLSSTRRDLADRVLRNTPPDAGRDLHRARLATDAEDWRAAADAFGRASRSARLIGALSTAADHLQAAVNVARLAGRSQMSQTDMLIELFDIHDALADADGMQRCLAQLDELRVEDRWVDVALRRGWSELDSGSVEAARATAERLLAAPDPSSRCRRGGALALLSETLIASGLLEQAATILERARETVIDDADRADVNMSLSLLYAELGNIASTISSLETAVEAYESAGIEEGSLKARRGLALWQLVAHGDEEWIDYLQDVRQRAKQIGDRRLEAQVVASISDAHVIVGDYGRGRPYALEAIGLARRTSDSWLLILCLNNMAMGEWDCLRRERDARVLLDEAILLAQQSRNDSLLALCHGSLAEIAFVAGDLETARTSTTTSLDIYTRHGSPQGIEHPLSIAIRLAVADGDLTNAFRLIEDATRIITEHDQHESEVAIKVAEAEALFAAGAYDDARRAAEGGLGAIGPGVVPVHNVLWRCSQVIRASGDEPRADVLVIRAARSARAAAAHFEPHLRADALAAAAPILRMAGALEATCLFIGQGADEIRLAATLAELDEARKDRGERLKLLSRFTSSALEQGRELTASELAPVFGSTVRTLQRDLRAVSVNPPDSK